MSRMALVVDDSMLIRHTICRFLEARGFLVESATNGREGLELATRLIPSLIITDMQMPYMTGEELIAALKERPETAEIPIVVLAARRSGSEPGNGAGAQFVIYKNIDIEEQLNRAIRALVQ